MPITEQTRLVILIIVITVISGLADAQGFVHAAKIWQGDRFVWSELGKSALGFAIGLALYWVVIRYMQAVGLVAPEIQTVIWFTVTLVGIALASGKFFKWQLSEQLVAFAVVAGIAWLLFRTGE